MDGERAETPGPRPEYLTTREVAELLRVRTRKVYEMAAGGEIPCRKLTGKLLFPREEIERWLARAAPGAAAAPIKRPAGGGPPTVVAGSHDPLLDWALRASGVGAATLFDGSLDGLDRVARGEAMAAGLHLFDPATGGWNVPQVRARLESAPLVLVTWAQRARGLLLAPGVADRITGPADLRGLRIAARQPSSGAGQFLAHVLAEAGLRERDLEILPEIARTETEAAAAVASGRADAAPGLAAAAHEFGLAFCPLVTERFDLLVDRWALCEPTMQALLAFAATGAFREKAQSLTGYDIAELGTVLWNGGR